MKAINNEPAPSTTGLYWFKGPMLSAILLALAISPLGCNKDQQAQSKAPSTQETAAQSQQPAVPPQQVPQPQPITPPAAKALTDLESMLAPIALYPDPLLAELLVASTYPLEVVQAARWLDGKPDLATLKDHDWDASIMRLTSVPAVIKMMNDHLDWTTQLGDAFLAKPAEVMATIQGLRKRAMEAGYLKDTPEQKVSAQKVAATGATAQPAVLQKEVISIQPAKTDSVSVPQYNPEVIYNAQMAPPPTVVNVNAASPAPSYYPTYYPATSTGTSSSNDSWMNFATGAVVGGLLTWGIMEWADDDWDDYHYVGHHYGNTVCHNGNCWHGGGGAYYADRGNVNYNRNINISDNEINVGRGGVFSQNNLSPSQQPAGWRPDPRHRRGQPYPAAAQQRIGRIQQPALAGQRLGAAQTLPVSTRGFAEAGQRASAGALPAERRPSSADIQRQLAQQPGARPALTENKPAAREKQNAVVQGGRDNALQGLKTSGQASALQSQRGASSRKSASSAGSSGYQTRKSTAVSEQTALPKPTQRSPGFAGMERRQPQLASPQPRAETMRPSSFESPRNTGATRAFSQRGASSVQRFTSAGSPRTSGSFGGGGRRR